MEDAANSAEASATITKETLTWTVADTITLQPSLPPAVHHAWERQPLSPFDPDFRARKVWKRYDSCIKTAPAQQPRPSDQQARATPAENVQDGSVTGGEGSFEELNSPARVVKRLCLGYQERICGGVDGGEGESRWASAPMRWERRDSPVLSKLLWVESVWRVQRLTHL